MLFLKRLESQFLSLPLVFQIAYPLISNSVAEAYQEGLSEPFWLLENNIAVVSLEPKDPG